MTADVLRLGNHPAGAEGAADGAAGVLADVRLYGSALSAAAVRELFVSSSLLGVWGGLGPAQAGVWGGEGEAAPAKAMVDDAPPQARTASPPLGAAAACSGGGGSGVRRKRQAPVMQPSDDDSDSDDDSGVGAGEEGGGGGGGGGDGGDGGDGGGGAGPSDAGAAAVEPRVTEEQGYARASHRAQGITQQRRPLMSLRERRRLTNRYTLALSSSNKTGYRGVFTNKSVSRPFTAEVKLRGEKRKSLGSFATSVEAAP